MNLRYHAEGESQAKRAELIFQVLARDIAPGHQTITYGELAKRVGIDQRGAGAYLNFVMRWCQYNRLPILTVLVINSDTWVPGHSFGKDIPALKSIPDETKKVTLFRWNTIQCPTAEDMTEAVKAIEG